MPAPGFNLGEAISSLSRCLTMTLPPAGVCSRGKSLRWILLSHGHQGMQMHPSLSRIATCAARSHALCSSPWSLL
jgi:hypothetical protein